LQKSNAYKAVCVRQTQSSVHIDKVNQAIKVVYRLVYCRKLIKI